MFEDNNNNTWTTWGFYQLSTYFTPFSIVSIIDFEQVNSSWGVQILVRPIIHNRFQPISGQCYTTIPPENITKPEIFWRLHGV